MLIREQFLDSMDKGFNRGRPKLTKLELKNFLCMDCGVDTSYGGINHFYMLQDEIWNRICPGEEKFGMLCLFCVEKRLGRKLVLSDFKNAPGNKETYTYNLIKSFVEI